MPEQESLKQAFFNGRPSLEFSPREITLWNGMHPVNLTDCDRIIINDYTIEFQRGRERYLTSLDDNRFFINHQFASPSNN